MTRWNSLRVLTTGAAGLLAAFLATAPAAAQESDEGIYGEEGMLEDQGLFEDEEAFDETGTATYDDSDYYGLYDAGYDQTYGNDWFYDYYEWSDPYSTEVGGYDYDYDADVFDWEEDGLFE